MSAYADTSCARCDDTGLVEHRSALSGTTHTITCPACRGWDGAAAAVILDPWLRPLSQADRDLAAACGVKVDDTLAGAA